MVAQINPKRSKQQKKSEGAAGNVLEILTAMKYGQTTEHAISS